MYGALAIDHNRYMMYVCVCLTTVMANYPVSSTTDTFLVQQCYITCTTAQYSSMYGTLVSRHLKHFTNAGNSIHVVIFL